MKINGPTLLLRSKNSFEHYITLLRADLSVYLFIFKLLLWARISEGP